MLLEDALDLLYRSKEVVGGKVVLIECKEYEKLMNFYKNNGFKYLQKVQTENNGELIQMFKLF
ncbi:precorrin-6B methylase 1 [Methanococcus voltae PS]|uniref:Precorrin-6B methylase 1 n=1 Tax=Methanococcus voltae PS TaxID=523842 RepID=A0ABT2EVH6_METVO|nr:hypothetical protein [Methanococcus voltae]MCS3921964.1 precorrin-6B methylase 1 [Methanococcus voltae PS]